MASFRADCQDTGGASNGLALVLEVCKTQSDWGGGSQCFQNVTRSLQEGLALSKMANVFNPFPRNPLRAGLPSSLYMPILLTEARPGVSTWVSGEPCLSEAPQSGPPSALGPGTPALPSHVCI